MARQPKSFFTPERRTLLEDLTGLSETDTAALELVGRYAAEKLWPQYEAINADSRAFHAAMDSLIDPKQLGFRGSLLPEELGGIDLSIPAYMMGLEMLSQGNASVALSLAIDGSVLSALSRLGDEHQLGRYVRDALRDKRMTAFALTEPGYGSDAGNLETRATTDGASWKLNGQKTWTTNGGWADYYFVVCRTNPDRNLGPAGLSVLMVHKEEIAAIEQIPKYTVPGSYTATLTFADSVVPAADGGRPGSWAAWTPASWTPSGFSRAGASPSHRSAWASRARPSRRRWITTARGNRRVRPLSRNRQSRFLSRSSTRDWTPRGS